MKRRSLIFDVDGTLLDPWIGLTRSVAYAFEQLGRAYPSAEEMRWFVGPPLSECFAELLGTNDHALISEALRLYRERFERVGISECVPYPDIESTLQLLSAEYDLYVATARIQRLTDLMLDHFGLAKYFVKSYGTQPDGKFDDKADLIGHIIQEHNLETSNCLMIGDRKHDVIAANANNIRTIAVSYGYGTVEELQEAGALLIVKSPVELPAILSAINF